MHAATLPVAGGSSGLSPPVTVAAGGFDVVLLLTINVFAIYQLNLKPLALTNDFIISAGGVNSLFKFLSDPSAFSPVAIYATQ